MKYVPRRENAATRKSKSSRATEQSIDGHQNMMKALNPFKGPYGGFEAALSANVVNEKNITKLPAGTKEKNNGN